MESDLHLDSLNNDIFDRTVLTSRSHVDLFYTVQRIFPSDQLAEHGMLAIQMRCLGKRDEELGCVCAGSAIGHGLYGQFSCPRGIERDAV